MPAGDAQIETAPNAAGEGGRNQAVGIVRHNSIGMQEQKNVAAGERRACIHRRAAITRRADHPIGEGARQRRRAVVAAAIDHDHFGATSAERNERR